jgi:hypothetical protein
VTSIPAKKVPPTDPNRIAVEVLLDKGCVLHVLFDGRHIADVDGLGLKCSDWK